MLLTCPFQAVLRAVVVTPSTVALASNVVPAAVGPALYCRSTATVSPQSGRHRFQDGVARDPSGEKFANNEGHPSASKNRAVILTSSARATEGAKSAPTTITTSPEKRMRPD